MANMIAGLIGFNAVLIVFCVIAVKKNSWGWMVAGATLQALGVFGVVMEDVIQGEPISMEYVLSYVVIVLIGMACLLNKRKSI